MDPNLMQILQGVIGQGNTELGSIFGELTNFMNKEETSNARERLNTNPLTDINAYRVNPFRGFLAKKGGGVDAAGVGAINPNVYMTPSTNLFPGGSIMNNVRSKIMLNSLQQMAKGGMVGSLPSIPASVQLDTINNVPSNMPGGAGGRFDLSQLSLQPNETFVIPKSQPFSDPIFGNKLFDAENRYQPGTFKHGGHMRYPDVDQAFLGGLFKGIGKVAKGIGKGLYSAGKAGLGAVGDVANTVSPIVGMFNPALGALAGLGGGLLGRLNDGGGSEGKASQGVGPSPFYGSQSQANLSGPTSGSLFDLIRGGGRQMSPNSGQLSLPSSMFNMTNVLGQTPFGSMFGSPGQFSVPGFAGGLFNIPRYQEGGPVSMNPAMNLIPIQTEKVGNQPEMIIHPDATITPVNATTRHKNMDDDEVTDLVPEGSYITSADKSMTITKGEADDIVLGVKFMPYKERTKGKAPKEITLASLWGTNDSDKNKKTFAELTQKLAKKIQVVDNSEYFEHGNNIFTQLTNKANLETRIPYLREIVKLNENSRPTSSFVFKHGGPVRVPDVPKAFLGGLFNFLGNNAGTIASAIPAISSLFGGADPYNQPQGVGGISPEVQAGILGSIPAYQWGLNQNLTAQDKAFEASKLGYSDLSQQLIQNAQESAAGQQDANLIGTGLTLMDQFGRETNLPKLDLGASRSRFNNFQPRAASRAAMEASSTPNYSASDIMAQLGRGAGPVLAQLESAKFNTGNQAAIQRNQQLDNFDFQRMQGLNQLDATEQQFNTQQEMREQQMRNDQRGNVFGALGQGVQRGADLQSGLLGQTGQIQSQILSILSDLNQQQANLVGQGAMGGSKAALDAFSILGGMQSQNALAGQLTGPQGGTLAPQFGDLGALLAEMQKRTAFNQPLAPIQGNTPARVMVGDRGPIQPLPGLLQPTSIDSILSGMKRK